MGGVGGCCGAQAACEVGEEGDVQIGQMSGGPRAMMRVWEGVGGAWEGKGGGGRGWCVALRTGLLALRRSSLRRETIAAKVGDDAEVPPTASTRPLT